MSRFFATGSDSESESSSSEEEILQPQQKQGAFAARTFQWSDEEVETKRVVRSAKDRRYDELKNAIKTLKNHKKIKDMANVLSDFEDIGKIYEKAKKVVEKDGIPKFYIRFLVELEDFVQECWEDREGRKAMSKNNAKGLTALRQKLRKYNRDFETELAHFRENPQEEEEPDSDDEDEGSDDEGGLGGGTDYFRKSPAKDAEGDIKGKLEEDDSEEDSDFWAMSSEDSGSSSDEEGQYKGQLTADYFRKKADDVDEDKKDTKKDSKKERKKKQKDEEGAWEEVKSGAPVAAEKPKMFSKDAEINHEAVFKKLREIIAARGKKGTDRAEQMDLLSELRTIAKAHNLGDAIDVKILFHLISAVFDYNPNIATCMKVEMWEKCLFYINEVLAILKANADDIIVGPDITDDAQKFSEDPPYRVRGSVLTVVERMDEEYVKMLQSCDAHSTEYVDRLKDEKVVCDIIEQLQAYMEPRGNTEEICRVYLKMIEHLYYKIANDSDGKDTHEVLDRLCKYIYSKDTTDRIRTRAILWHIYHHAMHDRWFEARDLMLMSHLQDTIQHSDIPTQIMYNRGLVQLGLCAFRQGFIKDAHNCLVDIQSSGRAKELLAQGLLLQRQHERTPEQEKIEKRRQMPYHMHINLEMLECVYLVSAMLMEIPYMAAHEFDVRRRLISKNFHHVLRVSDRQPLVGPPESMREHVVAASKTMKLGRWKECHDFIINEKMNGKVWDLFLEADRVRGMIKKKIQEESLRTYLFTYSGIYDSLSMITLGEMFELERSKVYSIISKMIINEELMASLDEPSQTVQMHRTEPTRMQSLALQLSEKVSSLVDYSERMMDMKQGLFYHRQGQGGGGYQQTQQGGYGGRGRQQRQGQEGGGYQRNQQGGYGGRGRQQRQGNRY